MQPEAQPQAPGDRRIFVTTQWTQVLQAHDSTIALENLCSAYRPALIAWLRARGEKPDEIEDAVQSFFAHLLDRNFLKSVSREKGRFRTFLLSSLKNFLADRWKHATAQKRGGGQQLQSLDATDDDGNPVREPISFAHTPDAAFDRAWAETVLARAMTLLQEECARTGYARLCAALEPVLFADDDAPAYAQIAAELNMTEPAVKMASMRIRQRIKRLIRDEVLKTTSDQQQLDEEVAYLRSLF